MPLFGPPDVAKLAAKKKVTALLKALEWQPHEEVRAAAARALGSIGDRQAVMPLAMALHDVEWPVRKAAADALSRMPDSRAIPYLVGALGDDLVAVRMAAAYALVGIGAEAVEPVIAALHDSGSYTRAMAAWALGRLRDRKAVMPLTKVLRKDKSADARLFAADALGLIGDRRAISALAGGLTDRDEHVRSTCREALERFDDPRASALLATPAGSA
jgi:HEAT repeat protein